MRNGITKRSTTRKEVYDYVTELLGRVMTPEERNGLKAIINKRIEEETRFVEFCGEPKPRVHTLLCTDCAAKATVTGYKEVKNVYKGRRRGFVAE